MQAGGWGPHAGKQAGVFRDKFEEQGSWDVLLRALTGQQGEGCCLGPGPQSLLSLLL